MQWPTGKKFSRLLFVFVHRVCLEKRMSRSKPGDSFKPFKKPEFIIAVENGQLMVKVSPCYH